MSIALALLVVLLGLAGGAWFLLHARCRPVPLVDGTLAHRQLPTPHGQRLYDTYVPRELVPDAPLVIALHGGRQASHELRALVGQALEQQARMCGFAVAYPGADAGGWRAGASPAQDNDDAVFILALIEAMADEHAIDTDRVFVLGYGSGGQMAYRLALTLPNHLAGVAAVAASLPVDAEPAWVHRVPPPPLLIINGTADRFNPFNGGVGGVLGCGQRAAVRSSRATADYFAQLAEAHLEQDETQAMHLAPRLAPMRWAWRNAQGMVVVLYGVKGAGHVLHQPYARQPRWLGAMNPGFDVAACACEFWGV